MSYRSRKQRRYRRKQAKAAAIDPHLTRGWGPDSKITRGDLRRVAQALRNDWGVPKNVREAIVARVCEVIDNVSPADGNARMLFAAADAVIQMQARNNRLLFEAIDELKREEQAARAGQSGDEMQR